MKDTEFKCLDCLKKYDKSLQSTHYPASCVFCVEARFEYCQDDKRDREPLTSGGERDED